MKNRIKQLSQSKFVRSVTIVATGTAGAQVITMAFAPIITRLYGPDAFGLLGVFMVLVAILAPITALTYPIAIVLPKDDRDAKALGWLSFYIALSMSFFFTILVLIWGDWFLSLIGSEVISAYVLLLPLAMLFAAILQIVQQWLIRKKQFKVTAKVAVYQALIVNSTKSGLGFLNPIAFILITVTVVGSFLHAVMLWMGIRNVKGLKKTEEERLKPAINDLKKVASNHKDFPIYRAPQVFINTISQSLPVLMLASFFGPAAAGFYSLAKSVLGMPVMLIGKSVGDVFYPRITEAAQNKENLTRLITNATLVLAALGIIPFGIVVIFGPWLFEFVFGQGWERAGEYASWLSFWFFVSLAARPAIASIPVLRLQRFFLIQEIASTLLRIGCIALGFSLFDNEVNVVILFSMTNVFIYLFLIGYVVYQANLNKCVERSGV